MVHVYCQIRLPGLILDQALNFCAKKQLLLMGAYQIIRSTVLWSYNTASALGSFCFLFVACDGLYYIWKKNIFSERGGAVGIRTCTEIVAWSGRLTETFQPNGFLKFRFLHARFLLAYKNRSTSRHTLRQANKYTIRLTY